MQLLNTLYVTTPDTYLRLDNDTLRVEVDHETRLRVPLHHLRACEKIDLVDQLRCAEGLHWLAKTS